jgi:hypothetical protein
MTNSRCHKNSNWPWSDGDVTCGSRVPGDCGTSSNVDAINPYCQLAQKANSYCMLRTLSSLVITTPSRNMPGGAPFLSSALLSPAERHVKDEMSTVSLLVPCGYIELVNMNANAVPGNHASKSFVVYFGWWSWRRVGGSGEARAGLPDHQTARDSSLSFLRHDRISLFPQNLRCLPKARIEHQLFCRRTI